MSKKKLTEKDYWEVDAKSGTETVRTQTRTGFKARLIDRYFGKIRDGYVKYLLYDVQCGKYLPEGKLKVLEVGSSPGNELLYMQRRFGYIPYGVEYTESGAELNRRNFAANGIDESQVIHADVFDKEFQSEYHEQFDVVMSHGLIEHFTEMDDIIRAHTDLLKPGGYLLLTVPNFRWLNYLMIKFFAPQAIVAHNLNIMKKKNMLTCCPPDQFEVLVCKFVGTWNCGLIYGPKKSKIKTILMNLFMRFQEVHDAVLYTFFKRGFIESALFSPKLMLLAKKKSAGGN